MADALVSAVVKELGVLAKDEVCLLVGVKDELRKLSSSFTAIQSVLEDAENQQVTEKAVRDWLGKLKDVAYEMDDILEEWRIEALESQGDEDDIFCAPLFRMLSCLQFPCLGFKKLKLRYDIGHTIRKITERLSEISEEKKIFKFNEACTSERPRMNERETSSLIDESEIFGRDAVKKEIVNGLVSETSKEKRPFSVVSIVGMGGLGKTTLAKLVYNDNTIMKHFEKRIWVCVSEDYDVNKILKKVLKSMDESTDGDLDLDALHKGINAACAKYRFLLVLDDVWDGILWEKLEVALKNAARGSRIVVTTRSREVADVMETTRPHYLGVLSDSDCWKLFTSRAFRGLKEEEWPLELTEVGKQIVQRCKGVPLSLRTVGSLLCIKRTEVEWQKVFKSETWEWKSPTGVDILPALLLSYYNLPIHLKQCFSFCSLFPKDYELEKDALVNLWMAHGFIKSEGEEIEENGVEYFDDLLTRSLLQDAEKDEEGNIVKCKMHDLVHDLARFVTTGDYCMMEIGNPSLPSVNSHHLSLLVNRNVSSIPSPLCSAEHLRTLFLFGSLTMLIKEVPQSLFNHLKFLRALNLRRTKIENLPSSLGKLKHLRYLDLSELDIKELPESVTDLFNLQTLKLNECTRLRLLPSGMSKMVNLRYLDLGITEVENLPSYLGNLKHLRYLDLSGLNITELPESVSDLCNLQTLKLNLCSRLCLLPSGTSKMVNLRHLEIEQTYYLESLPSGIGRLSSLRTLSKFPVGDENNRGCKIGELRNLNLLRGELEIQNLEKLIINPDEAREAELDKKCHLQGLFLECNDKTEEEWGEVEMENMERVFEGLGPPHSNLKLLHIYNYAGSKFPSWLEVMPSLDELYFYDCKNLKALPNCLPNTLRRVQINNCSKVIWAPDNPLPLLEDLILKNNVRGILSNPLPCLPALKKLRIWSTSIESLPSDGWGLLESLNTLEIFFCHGLRSLPNGLGQLPALQFFSVGWCSELRSLFDGFERLKSLHQLTINDCPELRPLPNGLQHLTALEKLSISKCPLVMERLEKEKGEDWCNISHIPCIWIDYRTIQ